MSSIAKFDVEKFDGSNDFGLWRVKMRCLLIQHGWEAALDPFPETMTNADKTTALKTDVYKKAHSALLLCLDNKVLREVNKESFAAGVWLKLETLYMTKSLANNLYLKKKLFTFYMNSESLTLEDVLSSLNSRELKKMADAKDDGDGLYVKGRSDYRGNQGRGSSRLKSKGKGTYKLKCHICYFEDHLKKDCPKKNKKKSTGFVKKNVRQGSSMNSEGYLVDGVLLGDNRACAIVGKGMKDGSSFVLENVRYILELKRNLIYLGTLDREGYTVKLHNKRVKMIKGSLMVLSGTMKGNSCLHELERRDVLENKGLGKLEFYENCVLGKSTRVSFGRGQHTTGGVIDYVHADLCGPSRVESMSGCRYFLPIVDDYSRREFNNLCKESGIERHLTVVGTPQQNGLAERMNMMLLNKVRCLLIQSGFLDSFWAEATITAAYLINRSLSTALKKKTPGKLKHRAIKSIFLGYPDGVKGYRLWRLDDVKPKIIISRDVVFNESLMYKDTLKGAGAADSGKEVEFEVELQGSRVEPTVDPHTGENPRNKDKEQDEGPQQQNLNNYVLVRDRAKRTTFIHARYRDESNVSLSRPSGSRVKDDMAAYTFAIIEEKDTHEPITFQEAINSSEKDEWVRAMEEEMSSLKKNHTWELVDQPPGQKLVSCKWLYKIKEGIKGVQKPRYKARLANKQSPGFKEGTGNKVCLLKKSLYGLKQSPRQWYKRFDVYMISNGFSRSSHDSCVYFKEFAPARKILGMEIVKDRGSRTLKVSQSGYVQKILNNYRMNNGKSVSMPLRAHFKVSLKDCPSNEWDVEIMSKIPHANVVGLVYGRDQRKHVDIDGFVDADYAKDPDKDRSIIGYVFMVHGCVVSWKATMHHVVALSTTDEEYMALTKAVKESIWLKGLLIELGVNLREIVESKEIEVTKIGTKDNAADTFTKVVPGPKFKVLQGDTWCWG
ncbi:retrovirus-related pol polyprotein from transposon TNT 1-94 [Tanacetum coccineum]